LTRGFFPSPRAHSVVPAKAGIQRKRRSAVGQRPAVYILANKRNGTLYIGVTSDPTKRVWEHKNDVVEAFTKPYCIHWLVWYELHESHESMESAITREKRIKERKRAWKLGLIESVNPEKQDLYHGIV
jgi:putative endonuclease